MVEGSATRRTPCPRGNLGFDGEHALHVARVVLRRGGNVSFTPVKQIGHAARDLLGAVGPVVARLEREVSAPHEKICDRIRHLVFYRVPHLADRVRQASETVGTTARRDLVGDGRPATPVGSHEAIGEISIGSRALGGGDSLVYVSEVAAWEGCVA